MYFPWSGDDGHYTSYILDHGQQQWFYVDDEKVTWLHHVNMCKCEIDFMQVTPVDIVHVLKENPFLLVYELCGKIIQAISYP